MDPLPKKNYCFAPSSSLYFGQGGLVSACNYNRTYILGKYPDQTVSEIWYGAQAEKMRLEIQKPSLAKGCYYCKKEIDAGNYAIARNYDNYENKKGKGIWSFLKRNLPAAPPLPQCFEFELSNSCNLECIMCNGRFSSAIRKNVEQLPPLISVYDDLFVQQLIPFIPHLKDAKFYGGEPFLIPIYYKIWEELIRLNPEIQITITTNGTIMSKKVKRVMEELRVNIVVSIDSFTKRTYESIRRNASFDQVMNNVQYFKEMTHKKGRTLSMAVCPMQANWKEIPAMVRSCNEEEIYLGVNTVWFPLNQSLRSLSNEELDAIIQFYEKDPLAGKGPVAEKNNAQFVGLIGQLKVWLGTGKKYQETSMPEKGKLAAMLHKVVHDGNYGNSGLAELEAYRQNAYTKEGFVKEYFDAVYLVILQHSFALKKDFSEVEALPAQIEALKQQALKHSQATWEIIGRTDHKRVCYKLASMGPSERIEDVFNFFEIVE